ncbi:S24 family peptidase [Aerococcus kribbianus]|uniref:Helix-turn-helix domain-containing protein n=1 Tax=Aerococcus kribbianus TaxID=2999064 RepID=A0A9X3FVV5_9LACT|nr:MULTISPECIES: S24 family peptidase [unclassified Aerococcus]MCZ0717867.1 helix-turn-helix domain-containing protein [Aerococcus sp. YH-aer221]MCZ0726154.1 helix-turn-helix domain-containing protein [Aerococcus sp. YH-aer222]
MDKERTKIISNNIRKNIENSGITQKQLAESIGIKPSTLSDYLNLRSNPSHGVIQKIADYFGILKSDIDTTYRDENYPKDESLLLNTYNKLNDNRKKAVRLYTENQYNEQTAEQNNVYQLDEYREEYLYGGASAGRGQYVYDEPVETVSVHTADIPNAPYDIMLKVVGDSMEPAFRNGEYIFVKRTEEIHNGAFGIFIINGESYLKKVYVEEDKLRLVSLNSNYDDLIFNDCNEINLIGKVVL